MKRKILYVSIVVVTVGTCFVLGVWYFSLLPQIVSFLQNILSFCYGIGANVFGRMLLSFPIALPYMLTISVFFTGIWLADRERHVHGFRNADLNFLQQALNLDVAKTPAEIEILVKKGKMWLKVSEHFRYCAVYLSFSTVHMILAAFLFAISLMFLSLGSDFFVITTCIGIAFSALSFLGHVGRYGYGQTRFSLWWSFYKRLSWEICDKFPPMAPPLILSHLARWKEVGEAIQKDKRFIDYLKRLGEYQHLKEFTEYTNPQKVDFFKF
ncbi:hypothetical protein E3J74_04525 [Candidatus Bathyarchaeota archaeon]|nr:MAG: hypothetical protein E3J74_04525 [Candidatus Bathyarchaeota archaeon]